MRSTARQRWSVTAVGALSVVLLVGPRLPGPAGRHMAACAVAFVALFGESLPFLLVGAVVAWVLHDRAGPILVAAAQRAPRLAVLVAPFMGAALPLCDCGVAPIARELSDAGAPGRVVTAFAAGAPLTNPIVIVSTAMAFGGSAKMVAGRATVGVATALAVAVFGPAVPRTACAAGESHDHGGTGLRAMASAELLSSGPALALGALAAGVVRGFAPTGAISALAAQPLLAVVAMVALAASLSICSQADAFVAASLPVGTAGRLAFLVAGPVMNLRLAAVYRRSFGGRWVLTYVAAAAAAIVAITTAWMVWGRA